jgi:hypothetical protein
MVIDLYTRIISSSVHKSRLVSYLETVDCNLVITTKLAFLSDCMCVKENIWTKEGWSDGRVEKTG